MPSNDLSIFHHENLRPNVPRSLFDLSFKVDCDLDFGRLQPVYYQDCVPNDTFTINVRSFVRSLPMKVPVLTRMRLRTAFYYVPYYLLWHKFDRFIFGGRDGNFTVLPPTLDYSTLPSVGSLSDYLGFPCAENLPEGITVPESDYPSAFRHLAYLRVYRDYYLDQDKQTSSNVNNWFPEDDFDFQSPDGIITGNKIMPNGVDTEADPALDLMEMRYRNFSVDYYTGCMLAPQRGDPIALPVSGRAQLSSNDLDENGRDVRSDIQNDFASMNSSSTQYATSGSWLVQSGQGASYVIGEKSANARNDTNKAMEQYLTSHYGINGNALGAFTVEDMRLATEMQAWLERNMRTKAQYNESLRIHFGDAPTDERLTKPYFIGGTVQDIVVSEVLQTSESSDGAPLGDMAGHGISSDRSYVGKFHSHEFGIIIGLASIMPDTSYIQQGFDRDVNKKDRYEYYFPEFAQLSPQGVLNKELFLTSNHSDNIKALGYIGRFDDMRFRFDRVQGLLSNPAKQDFFNWTLARRFDELPTLVSDAFINSKGNVRHDAWTTGNSMSPFLAEFAFDVRAVRPLPVSNRPMNVL